MHINGDAWAAAFLAREPDYTLAGWIEAYKKVFIGCRPDLTPGQVTEAAHMAFAREGMWKNPKIAAGCGCCTPHPPSGWWMPLKRAVLPERPPLKNLRMSRGAHLYRRFSVDRSTDLANLDEAFEKIQERRARRESQLITMLLIAIAAVCAAVVAALR